MANTYPLQHVVVLMLENRSFDHLFGLSGIYGVQPPAATFGFGPGAPDALGVDPPHEYEDVAAQVAGGAMTGFAASGGASSMQGFEAGRNPVLKQVAEAGLLMDNWFSSMPGPTWPNRFFAHAASSGGLDNSPGDWAIAEALVSPLYSYKFQHGHIFDRLLREGKSWRIYKGDSFPQVLSLQGMVDKRLDRNYFRNFSEFKADAATGDLPAYTFIEPQYGSFTHFAGGNSQHPMGSVSAGERLLRDTYNALFQAGSDALLLVTWDEHGGLFDHVTPPAATPPGDDQSLNHKRSANPRDCKFDRLGPRVPALLVSPWLPTGLGSQVFAGQVFEHASILAFLREVFQLGEPLTRRDASASSWHAGLLKTPRSLPTLNARLPGQPAAPAALAELQGISHSILGTLHIATAVDWDLAAKTGQPPLLAGSFKPSLSALHQSLTGDKPTLSAPAQQQLISAYLAAVDKRERATQRKQQRKSKG